MAKSSNQKLKVLYLAKILLERTDEENALSLAEITEALSEYGVSAERKSLYDDFESLRVFGIDVEKKHGKTVEYYVANREFELPELKLLVDAVQASKFITHKKSTELIKKIEGFASIHEARKLHRQVFVANRIKTMNESIYYIVDFIHDAIIKNSQISFEYFDWNEKKEKILRHGGKRYVVSPWALTWDDENYYMIAYDAGAEKIKHYRVDKMMNITVLSDEREGAEIFENFDMALYSKKTFGMYGGRDENVTLQCKNSMAGIIVDRFGREVIMTPVDGEHFSVTVKVAVSPLFLTWIMNFGTDIKIISPQNVIDEFIATAKKAIEQY